MDNEIGRPTADKPTPTKQSMIEAPSNDSSQYLSRRFAFNRRWDAAARHRFPHQPHQPLVEQRHTGQGTLGLKRLNPTFMDATTPTY